MSDVPKPPPGLRAPGKQLWADVVSRYELTAGELEVLRQAAHTVDEADKLERELRRQPFTVTGYAGQPRPNPLFKVLQDHRLVLRRLIDSLCLPNVDQEVGTSSASKHAQKAAVARWSNGG